MSGFAVWQSGGGSGPKGASPRAAPQSVNHDRSGGYG